MTAEIGGECFKNFRIFFYEAERLVAPLADNPTDFSSYMVMVDMQSCTIRTSWISAFPVRSLFPQLLGLFTSNLIPTFNIPDR